MQATYRVPFDIDLKDLVVKCGLRFDGFKRDQDGFELVVTGPKAAIERLSNNLDYGPQSVG